jgi:archaeal cell division control protein 6
MGVFDKILKNDETLFKNEVALSYDYIPKLIPYRENQQFQIANCIKPLFSDMNGRNIIICGLPGIGKTVATRHVLMELEEKTAEIIPIYINCWQKQTSFKIFLDICDQIEYKFTHNKRTEELFDIIKKNLNKKSVVFVFDEIDKTEDFNFLYTILEEIYRKTIICITNYKSWISSLDERIMSRLVPEHMDFNPYNKVETKGIIEERIKLAFFPDVWNENAIQKVIDTTFELKDIRSGLYLLKESGLAAEEEGIKEINIKHVEKAISKLQDFKIKKVDALDEDVQEILKLIKKHSPTKIGELHKIYLNAGGTASYKTFQRRIEKLKDNKYISVTKQLGGAEGTTTIITYNAINKEISDF